MRLCLKKWMKISTTEVGPYSWIVAGIWVGGDNRNG